MVVSVTLGFMHFAIIGHCENGYYLNVCVPKFVYYWMLISLCICCCSRVHIYICLRMYWHASTHLSTVCWWEGRRWKEEGVRRKEWVKEGKMDCCYQNFFYFLTLKVYFDLNKKCLFCREFSWVMMMIKIKISITLIFLCGIYGEVIKMIVFGTFYNDDNDNWIIFKKWKNL